MAFNDILVRHLGRRDYQEVFLAMRAFTNARSENTLDEVWCVEHPCVYTVGKASRTPSPTHTAPTLVLPTHRGADLT